MHLVEVQGDEMRTDNLLVDVCKSITNGEIKMKYN
jgi:hypothetical protein